MYTDNAVLLSQVPLDELQSVLLSHAEVEDAFVIYMTNEEQDTEQVKAIVVRKGDINEHELTSFITQNLPSIKQINKKIQFHFVEKIPKDSSGKVVSQELEERELNGNIRMNGKKKSQDDNNIVRSKYPDVKIPDDMSWSEFIMQHFEEYGNKRALVSNGCTAQCSTTQYNTPRHCIAQHISAQ